MRGESNQNYIKQIHMTKINTYKAWISGFTNTIEYFHTQCRTCKYK